jgi:rare lipoprotein A
LWCISQPFDSNGGHILGKVKKASSLTASIALCAIVPLNFLTAHGHTLPESNASTNQVRQDVEDNRPTLQLPEHLDNKSAMLPPAAINSTVDSTIKAKSPQISVITTRETGHASVYVNRQEVIKFRADAQNSAGVWQTPTERALTVQQALEAALVSDKALSFTTTLTGGKVYLTLNGQRFAEVDTLTARQARTTAHSLAMVWTNKLKKAANLSDVVTLEKPVVKTADSHQSARPRAIGRFLSAGKASWYGPGFHGRRAANGSVFNQFAMTAAHKSLPFGTLVRVTNKANGKQCVVKITDRGPFCGGRVIDLSRKAAESLGMLGSGVASVSLESMPNT